MEPSSHIIDLLPDFLTGSSSESERVKIQAHLQVCESCKREYESLSTLWNTLGAMPEEKPGSALRERFFATLSAYEQGISHARSTPSFRVTLNDLLAHIWPGRPLVQMGIALLLFLLGGFIGTRINQRVEETPKNPATGEIAQLRGEVLAMSRMLAVSLLQQQSASERLRGVSLSYKTGESDPEIVSALLGALKYDPNVGVRLAALDALSRAMDEPGVRQELLKDLPKQSPLVQIAMVDLMVEVGEKQSVDVFKQMAKDKNLNATVKKRLEEGMKQLL
ncbi:MAG: zf-HC2 domain-containing protein [Bacteroidota bacterium]